MDRPRAKIIAVDMDGTLCNETCWTYDDVRESTVNPQMRDYVNDLFIENYIVIYTCRRDHLISETMAWLRRNGVQFHAISNMKSYADLYIDDKAVNPEVIKNEQ